MNVINQMTAYLEGLSQQVPVELFTFLGALIEEIIAPIPSPVIMTLAGSVSSSQQKTVVYLLVLAVIGAIGKIIGSFFLYFVADKAEDFFVSKFGKLLGIKQGEIEGLSKYFTNGKKDFVLIFFARFIPIFPTAPISVVAGILKLNLKTYLLASFLGYIGRNLIYLYFGYVGHESYQAVLGGLDNIESVVQVLIGAGMLAVIVWFYYQRSKSGETNLLKRFQNKLQ